MGGGGRRLCLRDTWRDILSEGERIQRNGRRKTEKNRVGKNKEISARR